MSNRWSNRNRPSDREVRRLEVDEIMRLEASDLSLIARQLQTSLLNKRQLAAANLRLEQLGASFRLTEEGFA